MQGRKKSKRRIQETRAKREERDVVVVVGAYITRNNLISVSLTFSIGEMSEHP